MSAIERRYMPGIVTPEGVNVTSHPRCGDADRDRASNRVSEAYAKGFIDKAEADARIDAIGQATLSAHLEELTRDIPVMARFSGATLKERRDTRAQEWVRWWKVRQPWIGLGALLAGLMAGILPTVLATAFHGGPWIAVTAAVTIPPAAVTALSGLVSVMAWGMEF